MIPRCFVRHGIFATSVVAVATSAFADVGGGPAGGSPYYYGPGMMWGGEQWGGFGMVLGPIFMILVLVGIVAGAFYLVRSFGGHGPIAGGSASDGRAMAMLRERFAKGEIDAKEFEERKRLLSE